MKTKMKALAPYVMVAVITVGLLTMIMRGVERVDPYKGLSAPSTMISGAALPSDYSTPVPTAEAPVTVGPPPETDPRVITLIILWFLFGSLGGFFTTRGSDMLRQIKLSKKVR